MGAVTNLLCLVAVLCVIAYTEASAGGSCPLPSKVYSCSPKCEQSYECSHGKVCCPNSCHAKSCSEPASGGAAGGDKYSSHGATGIYCGNVKCSPHEKCITDPSTKRQKCGRA